MLHLLLAAASITLTAPPNDPLYLGVGDGDQWNLMGTVDPAHPSSGIRGIDAEGAWAITAGRPDVVIAVLDSGVMLTHDDLADNIDINFVEAAAAGIVDGNGDGVITLAEAQASGVTDLDGDGKVTPNDVRLYCENGVDDDANGYVDDIVGWDFQDDDNDPTDVYGHGTGRAGIAAAVANNGIGMAGVCPGCRILPVRIGRTFVAVPDKLAEAIEYATDRGAAATVMATGALGNSSQMRAAVEYADAHGVAQCVAIGNEDSRHHHLPQIYRDVIPVTGIKPDRATDYSARWTGSNFGAHAAVAAPTFVWATHLDGGWGNEGGTSSSVPHCAGVAGLVISRARDLGITLSARQVRSILMETADHPDEFHAESGYGRLNALAAVERVGSAPPPPDARIVSPPWYREFAPGPVSIDVAVATSGATSSLEMGYGVEPSSWTPVTGGSVSATPPAPGDPLADRLGDSYAVTVRLTTTGSAGTIAVDRRTFFVHDDPDLLPGFPVDVGSSAEGSAILVDLDGDNRPEILFATSDGRVHAFDAAGATELSGWPVSLGISPVAHADAAAHAIDGVPLSNGTPFAGLAGGDLDGDLVPEVVATALDGKLYAWHANGAPLAGFPLDLGSPVWAAPTLADLDGDGTLSIVAAAYDGKVHVLDATGAERPGFPVTARDATADAVTPGLIGAPAIGDLDGDGAPDIVIATTESSGATLTARGRVYAFHADGTPFAGYPVEPYGMMPETFPVIGSGVPAQPILADLDGDGALDVLAGAAAGQIAAFDGTGAVAHAYDHGSFIDSVSPYGPPKADADPDWQLNLLLLAQPVVADLANSGKPDVIAGTMALHEVDLNQLAADPGEALTYLNTVMTVWTHDGHVRTPFPLALEGWTLFQGATVADLDADSLPEVLAPSDGGWIHAWNARGEEAPGFPKFTGGWLTNVAVGDLDADGKLDLVTITREGQLFAWKTGGAACVNDASAARWPVTHHDPFNSGDRGTDAVPPAAVADAHVENGRIVFTAVGDDGFAGRAAAYDARWSTAPIASAADFEAATAVAVSGTASPGAALRSAAGVPDGAHVAVIARDEAGNRSMLPGAAAAVPPADACVRAAVIHLDGGGGSSGGCRCEVARGAAPAEAVPPVLLALGLVVAVGIRRRTR